MEEDNSVYEVERVCFDYERSLKEGLFRLWENKYQPCYARMTSTSTSPSCRHSTQAPFPRCKFFSWLVRTEWTRLIGRGEREWKPPNYGDKRKKWKDKKDNTERLQGSLARHTGGSSWRLGHRLSQVKRNCWNCGTPEEMILWRQSLWPRDA